jgi:sodium/proline symporter
VPVEGYTSLWGGLGPAAAIGFGAGLLGIGLGYPGQPHVVNRFMALREGAAEIRIARVCAIGWAAVVYAGMILLGLCARIKFPDLADGEQALTHAAETLFGPVVAGIMIAAVLSAVMSTADSQLLVAASSVTHDLGLGGGTRASLLVRSRVVVLALSAGAVVAALTVDATIFDRVLFAWSAMGFAFGPLLLVTVFRPQRRRLSRQAAGAPRRLVRRDRAGRRLCGRWCDRARGEPTGGQISRLSRRNSAQWCSSARRCHH